MFSLKSILGFLIFILVVHTIATINYWYWTFRWLDIPMHFLGGLWLAMLFFYFINPKLQITSSKLLVTIILSLAFVALIGVLWEFFEFLYDFFIAKGGYAGSLRMFPYGMKDLHIDTLSDLFFDLLGGLTMASIFQLRKNKDYSLE